MSELRRRVDEVATGTGFAGVVRLERGGVVALDVAYGLADRRHDIAMNIDNQLGMASGSAQRLRTALHGRVAIERAKGVLAQTDNLEMDEAFTRLVQVSDDTARPLSQVAQEILHKIVVARP